MTGPDHRHQWIHRLHHRTREETGAALLLVLAVISLVALWVAASLNTLSQTQRATQYNVMHTQALYNARMGVDTLLYYLGENESALFSGSSGPAQVQSTIASDLASLNAPPFQVTVTFGAESGTAGDYSIPATIVSIGTAGTIGINGARVTLTIPATVTEQTSTTGSSGGAGSGSGSTSSTSETSTIAIDGGTGSIGIQTTGLDDSGTPDGPDVSVNAQGQVTVTGFANLNTVSADETTTTPPNNASDWIAGNQDTTDGSVNGTAIVTGSGDTLEDSVNGEAIVTGTNDTLDGPVDGPLVLTGNSDTIEPNADVNGCSAIVTGDSDKIYGAIDGILIVTGSHDTFGTANDPLALNEGVILIGSDDTFDASVDALPTGTGSTIPANTAVIALGTGDVIDYQNFNGSIDEYPAGAVQISGPNSGNIAVNQIAASETYTVDASCLGSMTLSITPPASGSGASLAHITLSFGTSSIEG